MTRRVGSAIIALAHALVGDISRNNRRDESIARSYLGEETTTLVMHPAPGMALPASVAMKKKL
ncbi:hypothetical protein [Xanthomonas floridensis]|uniref:Uncharacterized protein n=1 Tax=Xanthomonas floridensis TaxID=1843580 RepID=A0A1A9M8G5_9XANT|nr:hypothetical protein [Xanthomonas floridensis]MEA5123143.1 hypothetical protein [Xanthomonas floridensis]MEA5130831.1 hypothetical protein [Xanthomonas floridensis]OAG66794.1 hypothetical protein A7D17_03430 [Xanthomonas floridensis]